MGTISDIKWSGKECYVVITRSNGTSYKVRSDHYEALAEYRNFYLKAVAERLKRSK